MKFKQYLIESQIKKRTVTMYHGVKKAENVQKILNQGFKLINIKPRWVNDYAVSAVKSKAAVLKYFGRDIAVIKFKFSGNMWSGDRWDTPIDTFASRPQDYTRDILKEGIDAVDLGGQYFVYNVKKISNVEVA